jgi:hypothetical protein
VDQFDLEGITVKGKYIVIAACLVFMGCIHAWTFETFDSLEGKVIEIKHQEEFASLMSGIDWSNNSTIYVMLPALLQEDSALPINQDAHPQADILTLPEQKVSGFLNKNLTLEESLRGGDSTKSTIALRALKKK